MITVAGTVGYVMLGFAVLDAVYQTVTTITTVGFREVEPLTSRGKVFTIVLILVGVGTALYTFSVLIEALVEGHFGDLLGRRRMERTINELKDHVIICGWGRVGRALARYVTGAGQDVVVIDRRTGPAGRASPPLRAGRRHRRRGLARGRHRAGARRWPPPSTTDADNLYVTIGGRALCPTCSSSPGPGSTRPRTSWTAAGANRVVNPQSIGGARMAAFALQPHVAEFLDVVMHDGSLEFRLEEMRCRPARRSPGRACATPTSATAPARWCSPCATAAGRFTTNPATGDGDRARPDPHRHRHLGPAGRAAAGRPQSRRRPRASAGRAQIRSPGNSIFGQRSMTTISPASEARSARGLVDDTPSCIHTALAPMAMASSTWTPAWSERRKMSTTSTGTSIDARSG